LKQVHLCLEKVQALSNNFQKLEFNLEAEKIRKAQKVCPRII
jgi:hypothetical protein